MDKKIVVINGSGGVGKDTFVELCSEFVAVRNISSVDKVKEAAKILVGWDEVKTEKSRKLLSDLKQLSIEFNDYPMIYIKEQIEEFKNDEKQKLMFIHIREISEIEKVKKELDVKTLLITSNRIQKITSNISDANVEKSNYDYHIANDGTIEELKDKAKEFVFK